MSDYARAAEYYDLLYEGEKDYPAEAALVDSLIRTRAPDARRILDVGCGTGAHARALTTLGYAVDGVDLEPAFVEIAAARCPSGTFTVGDMTSLDVPGAYDAVVCLFSAIGYARTADRLRAAVAGMAGCLVGGGVLLVDPWFEPGQLTDGWVHVTTGRNETTTVVRMSRTVLDGDVSRLEFEYLVGSADGIERRTETHELGLFTQTQMEEAFQAAGLAVERLPEVLRTRGVYVGIRDA